MSMSCHLTGNVPIFMYYGKLEMNFKNVSATLYLQGYAVITVRRNDYWSGWIGFYAPNSTQVTANEDMGHPARLTIERRNASYGDLTVSNTISIHCINNIWIITRLCIWINTIIYTIYQQLYCNITSPGIPIQGLHLKMDGTESSYQSWVSL